MSVRRNCGFKEREMGLRKRCLTAGLVVLATLCFAPSALAWTFSTTGGAICDTSTGEHVITWTIDNRTEPETLTIRQSSRAAVAVGSTVPARSVRQFVERLAGTTVGTVSLTVKGNWPSDTYLRTRSASVTLSAACVRDQCPNLTGVQEQVPSGMVKDSAGSCITPPTDVCPNIEGVQEQVPSGMIKNEAGHCVSPPPTDVCPNLAGVQEEVPAGMVKDSSGDCITPPTDVCPNIEGLQTALPEGFAKDEGGDCVYPPRVVTVTVETVLEKTIEKQVEVPGPERVVTLAASPSVVEKVIERVVTKVVIKKIKAVAKKKAKRKKRKAIRPRVLPFTP
jgi:hypothetical protein